VTGAPVVDDAGRLVGMLTEKDCMRLLTMGDRAEAPSGSVADYMTTDITTVTPDMDVYFAAGLFLNEAFRRLPVVEGGRLVGAITRFDLLRVVLGYLR
jgi:CBS domain-containing protein